LRRRARPGAARCRKHASPAERTVVRLQESRAMFPRAGDSRVQLASTVDKEQAEKTRHLVAMIPNVHLIITAARFRVMGSVQISNVSTDTCETELTDWSIDLLKFRLVF